MYIFKKNEYDIPRKIIFTLVDKWSIFKTYNSLLLDNLGFAFVRPTRNKFFFRVLFIYN